VGKSRVIKRSLVVSDHQRSREKWTFHPRVKVPENRATKPGGQWKKIFPIGGDQQLCVENVEGQTNKKKLRNGRGAVYALIK